MSVLKITKALGDQNRLRILNLLSEGELCGCELEGILAMSQSNVSRHLSKLNEALVTDFRKDAKYSYYSLNGAILAQYPFIDEMMKSLKKEKVYVEDLKRLQEYREKDFNCDTLKENILLFLTK